LTKGLPFYIQIFGLFLLSTFAGNLQDHYRTKVKQSERKLCNLLSNNRFCSVFKALINKETYYWVKIAIADVIHTKLGCGN
jgi:hypothetical protein